MGSIAASMVLQKELIVPHPKPNAGRNVLSYIGNMEEDLFFLFNIRISRDKRFLISYYVRTSAGISRSGAGVCVVSDCKISGTAI